jgi:uncharacterized protein YyaL (SSP411 family)
MSAPTPAPENQQHRFTNRLSREKSPYLLQHAHNPVDWYPWGEEALARARDEDKPIFLSVGYSACHWCHVMERESFENEHIAHLLNHHFISIKVDREERPDVDEIYMTAVQMMTQRGGWPMSVFLTPDGRPFYGGTYFPPDSRQGRIGFGSLVSQLADAWKGRREEVEEAANSILENLEKAARQRPMAGSSGSVNPTELLHNAVAQLAERFDEENGGFGGAPKFPPHHSLRLLCDAARQGNEDAPRLLITTLDRMALGGIYDHIGGGFHRYATDAVWLLPHFEKMLYDNALLARVYADAYDLTGRTAYARIVRETCDWVLRDLRDAGGAFHAALDADSEGEEGKYYVWRYDDVLELLGKEQWEAFTNRYQMLPDGNFHDEATGQATGTNIPYLSLGAQSGVVLPDELGADTLAARETLLSHRYQRIPPGKDDKVITAWNGLMIGAFALAGQALNEPRYIEAAREAAEFCLNSLRTPEGMLLRRYAGGEAAQPAFLDDHAYLADGLLDLYEATGDTRWIDEARSLTETLLERFWDHEDQGFFYTGDGQESLITRTKDLFDGALPSANGVATRVLVRLGNLPEGKAYRERAQSLLGVYHGLLQRAPQGTQTLILAAQDAFEQGGERKLHSLVLLSAEEEYISTLPAHSFTATFALTIAPGYHINARQPTQSHLIPTTGTLTFDVPASVGPLSYPEAVSHVSGGEALRVYEDVVRFALPVTIAANAIPGRYRLTLALRYQVCSETECLAPQEQYASVAVDVASPGV